MKPIATFVLLLIPFIIEGCTFLSTPIRVFEPPSIVAFTDPAFAGHQFRRVAVLVDTAQLTWRRDLEDAMTRSLRSRDVDAGESYRVIPPTRAWDASDRRAALAGNGFDAYLRLIVDSVIVEERTVPVTTSTTTKRELKRTPPMTGYDSASYAVENETVTTKSEGGYTVRTTRMRYRALLVDVASGRTAWMGLNEIGEDPAGRVGSFCNEIAAQLLRDSIVWRVTTTS